MSDFHRLVNEQIGNEFGASAQYIAVAVHYDARTLPRLAAFFYAQAVEERNHAMMLVKYLLDRDLDVVIPGVAAPRNDFDDDVQPIAIALEQEQRVTDQISGLAKAARSDGDFVGEQFVGWFLKEQVEEVATMNELLDVAERLRDRPMDLEEYLAREHAADAPADPTAPAAAGGAL